jgi:hypothetical protein
MTIKNNIDEQLKRFAIVNTLAQLIFLIILAIPMFICEDFVYILAGIWILASAYFLYLTIEVKFVDKVWNFFKSVINLFKK